MQLLTSSLLSSVRIGAPQINRRETVFSGSGVMLSSRPFIGLEKTNQTNTKDDNLCFGLEELRHVAELVVAGVEEIVCRHSLEFQQLLLQDSIQKFGGLGVIVVSAAGRLGNDSVDDAELGEIPGGDAHGFGSDIAFAHVAPHDGGASFR